MTMGGSRGMMNACFGSMVLKKGLAIFGEQ
jgi:hypothetical protein